MKPKVAVITTSRADYSHLYWVLRAMQDHPGLELRLIVSGAHLSDTFGHSIDEIRSDGFPIAATVPCLDPRDTDIGMAKTIGNACLGLADVLADERPDLLLLIADRYEMLAPAAVATALRIPIAHIEGGEVSRGAIDDTIRNALTKLSHLHFVPHSTAEARVLAMGEENWRIHRTGAPSLDHLVKSQLLSLEELERKLGLSITAHSTLVVLHPVTMLTDTLQETEAVFQALERIDRPLLFCFPNADAGSRRLIDRSQDFVAGRDNRSIFVNLNPVDYWSLLRQMQVMLGNSSSGIMETPSLAIPTVNIGRRQEGRERARNIIDSAADAEAILQAHQQAISTEFLTSLEGMTNPYGNGYASEKIVEAMLGAPFGQRLLEKAPVTPG